MGDCVMVLEKETSDIYVLTSRQALVGHVEEFFDCIESDFLYIDEDAFVLTFDKDFLLSGADTAIQRRPITMSEAEACLASAQRGLRYKSAADETCLGRVVEGIRRLKTG